MHFTPACTIHTCLYHSHLFVPFPSLMRVSQRIKRIDEIPDDALAGCQLQQLAEPAVKKRRGAPIQSGGINSHRIFQAQRQVSRPASGRLLQRPLSFRQGGASLLLKVLLLPTCVGQAHRAVQPLGVYRSQVTEQRHEGRALGSGTEPRQHLIDPGQQRAQGQGGPAAA